jgi:hypothetical protein
MDSRRIEQIAVVAITGADPSALGQMTSEEQALFDELANGPKNVDIPNEVPDVHDSGLRVKDAETECNLEK